MSYSYMNTLSDTLRVTANRSLTSLGTNYVGAQSEREMANGAFNFDMDAAGRTAAHLCLLDIQRTFNGHLWVQNGPWVIQRVLQTLCGTERVSMRTLNDCLLHAPHFNVKHLCILSHSKCVFSAVLTSSNLDTLVFTNRDGMCLL